MLRADMDSLASVSKLKVCLGSLVGDDRGGVTGALFDILRGGRAAGMALMRKANGCSDALDSLQDGLGNDEDCGLGWYEGIGLAK